MKLINIVEDLGKGIITEQLVKKGEKNHDREADRTQKELHDRESTKRDTTK